MLEITILAVGKIREKAIAGLCAEYAGRIERQGHTVRTVEVRDEPGDRSEKQVLAAEAERIRAKLQAGAFVAALDREGKSLDSRELAGWLGRLAESGRQRLCFVIGGPLGLDRSLAGRCDFSLSLSKMTLPHELARLVLLEQLYRANTILRGEPYHK
ncbi:MAG: 23S rRNA (pseudouridine(1915)-N(3))-methyltransferase RlmH [Candidatus Glassbacteria bacterium]